MPYVVSTKTYTACSCVSSGNSCDYIISEGSECPFEMKTIPLSFHGSYPTDLCLTSDAMIVPSASAEFVASSTQKAWNMHSYFVLSGLERRQPGHRHG